MSISKKLEEIYQYKREIRQALSNAKGEDVGGDISKYPEEIRMLTSSDDSESQGSKLYEVDFNFYINQDVQNVIVINDDRTLPGLNPFDLLHHVEYKGNNLGKVSQINIRDSDVVKVFLISPVLIYRMFYGITDNCSIEFKEGFTSVGNNYVFYGNRLINLIFPSTLVSVDRYGLYNVQISGKLQFKSPALKLAADCFYGCNIIKAEFNGIIQLISTNTRNANVIKTAIFESLPSITTGTFSLLGSSGNISMDIKNSSDINLSKFLDINNNNTTVVANSCWKTQDFPKSLTYSQIVFVDLMSIETTSTTNKKTLLISNLETITGWYWGVNFKDVLIAVPEGVKSIYTSFCDTKYIYLPKSLERIDSYFLSGSSSMSPIIEYADTFSKFCEIKGKELSSYPNKTVLCCSDQIHFFNSKQPFEFQKILSEDQPGYVTIESTTFDQEKYENLESFTFDIKFSKPIHKFSALYYLYFCCSGNLEYANKLFPLTLGFISNQWFLDKMGVNAQLKTTNNDYLNQWRDLSNVTNWGGYLRNAWKSPYESMIINGLDDALSVSDTLTVSLNSGHYLQDDSEPYVHDIVLYWGKQHVSLYSNDSDYDWSLINLSDSLNDLQIKSVRKVDDYNLLVELSRSVSLYNILMRIQVNQEPYRTVGEMEQRVPGSSLYYRYYYEDPTECTCYYYDGDNHWEIIALDDEMDAGSNYRPDNLTVSDLNLDYKYFTISTTGSKPIDIIDEWEIRLGNNAYYKFIN